MTRTASLKIGDLVARVEAPTVPYRVTSKIGSLGVRVLPWRRGGSEVVLTRMGSLWTDGTSRWILTGRS